MRTGSPAATRSGRAAANVVTTSSPWQDVYRNSTSPRGDRFTLPGSTRATRSRDNDTRMTRIQRDNDNLHENLQCRCRFPTDLSRSQAADLQRDKMLTRQLCHKLVRILSELMFSVMPMRERVLPPR